MSILDTISKTLPIIRETYGSDVNNKPNDHCNWVDVGYSRNIFVWEENDEHFRNRIKSLQGV